MAPPLQSLQKACGGCQQAMLQELLALLLCPEGLLENGRQGQGPLPGGSTIMSPGTGQKWTLGAFTWSLEHTVCTPWWQCLGMTHGGWAEGGETTKVRLVLNGHRADHDEPHKAQVSARGGSLGLVWAVGCRNNSLVTFTAARM